VWFLRFGLGWRPELAAGIVANLERIDVVEVIADDFIHASSREKRALRFLRSLVPVVVHATSLGLATTARVDRKRLDAIARVIGWLEPEFWSEHLAFVRHGSIEIGHLAAPPRNVATFDGLCRNVEEVARVVGSAPLLENVATLVDPPLSMYSEAEWLRLVAQRWPLLLDLHNLHANATNFRFSAGDVVRGLFNVGAIHLAGGRTIEGGRILDDHLHDVPDPVFTLLREVSAPTVILERDGNYPMIDTLLADLDRARSLIRPSSFVLGPSKDEGLRTKDENEHARGDVFHLLAEVYAGRRSLADPAVRELNINPEDLALAARSFARKRYLHHCAVPVEPV